MLKKLQAFCIIFIRLNFAFWRFQFGWKEASTIGSNLRRAYSRGILILNFYLIFFLVFTSVEEFERVSLILKLISICLVAFGVFYFICNIVAVVFMQDGQFIINPYRLFSDLINSTVFTVISFSFIFRIFGIVSPDGSSDQINFIDYIYFSAVTFSTLGYGDFRPAEGAARLFAGLEALIGNLHLGFLVGTAFLAANYWQHKSGENKE